MILTALYDSKAKNYFNFATVKSIEEVRRFYAFQLKNGEKNTITTYPEDFILCSLGLVSEVSGSIIPKLENICQLSVLKYYNDEEFKHE